MTVKCCFCGDQFELDKETMTMLNEGEISSSDAIYNSLCDDCNTGVNPFCEESRSDADSGL